MCDVLSWLIKTVHDFSVVEKRFIVHPLTMGFLQRRYQIIQSPAVGLYPAAYIQHSQKNALRPIYVRLVCLLIVLIRLLTFLLASFFTYLVVCLLVYILT